jgi:hypothetical protein
MTWTTPTYERWGETPTDYEPEKWDVVRDDGLRIIEGTNIVDADVQVAYLNARLSGRHSYETRPADQQDGGL